MSLTIHRVANNFSDFACGNKRSLKLMLTMNVQKFTRIAIGTMAVLMLMVQVAFAQGQPTLETVTKAFNEAITKANEDPAGTIDALNQVIADAGTLGQEGEEIKGLAESKLAPLYYKVAYGYSQQKQYGEAIPKFEKTLKVAEQYNDAEVKGKVESMLPQLYYIHGSSLLKAKDIEGATANFDKALALNENYAKAHYGRAKVLFKTGKKDEALALVDKIIGMDDAKTATMASKYAANYLYRKARSANKSGKYNAALDLIAKALKYNKGATHKFYNQQGKAYQGLGQKSQACAAYGKVGGKYAKYAKYQMQHKLKCN